MADAFQMEAATFSDAEEAWIVPAGGGPFGFWEHGFSFFRDA